MWPGSVSGSVCLSVSIEGECWCAFSYWSSYRVAPWRQPLMPFITESQQSFWTGCPLTAPGLDNSCIIARVAIDLGIWYCISVEHSSSGALCSLTHGCTCMSAVHNLCIACNYTVINLKNSFLVWESDFLNIIHRGHTSSEKAAHHCWRHKLLHWVHFMESAHRHWGKYEF